MIQRSGITRSPLVSIYPLAALALICLVAGCARPRGREILIIARGMAFTLPSDPTVANPVIPMHSGERVRVVLKNEAQGLIHNFEVPSWGVKTPNLRAGETTEIEFTVPPTAGRVEYICRPHSELMKGVVEVSSS